MGAILETRDKQAKELSEDELIAINEENDKKDEMSHSKWCWQKNSHWRNSQIVHGIESAKNKMLEDIQI